MLYRGDATRRTPTTFSEPLHEWRRLTEERQGQVVESLAAFAQPSGITVRSVYEGLRDEILADLEAALPVDVVLLSMHGAMVADGYDDWSYQTVFNLLGWPALCVRAGSGEAGLPVAVQIVGAPWRDDRVLALGRCVERNGLAGMIDELTGAFSV